ncbi:T9SS type A sorting domain-containing protein [Mucilaginibacter sp. ZT4R22]|uniref:T9SS type A sorting domain-containing protein n=1 Tax=Mucilaginibacter pankratovii TaxID=2772110 RepID=A0ABR7WXA1_9SPHI|nr:T9SS type A sorting domain-containing protein [Mucilaginibacter pankratovii]MBD1366925.1 T9SS type A sorting domain-containing protein [Mucilaginibacter pankratovii]
MKKLLLICSILVLSNTLYAQRYITRTFGYTCYNFFDDNTVDNTNSNNTLGVYAPGFSPDPNVSGNNTTVIVSAGTTLNLASGSGKSLTSRYLATPKGISSDFMPNATDVAYKTINSNDWEWSLLYKSNLTGSTYPTTPPTNVTTGLTTATNSWRYWLFANTSTITSSTDGFYLTQNSSGNLVVYVVNNGTAYSLITSNSALTNGTTYCIKIQRLVGGSWRMYLDPYATSVTQAKTLQSSTTTTSDGHPFTPLTYSQTYLEAENSSAATDGAFQWDNIHMYTRYLKFTNITSAANGVTQSPFYGGMGNVILWGCALEMRGNYDLGISGSSELQITNSGSAASNFANGLTPCTIYKTTDSYFSTTSANTTVLTSNFQMYSGTGQGGMNDDEVTSGNTDGSLSIPVYWFIGATVNASPTPGTSLTISGVSAIKQDVNNNPVTGTVVFSSGTGATITFGDVWDWTGNNGSWISTSNAWLKNGSTSTSHPQVASDVARIGVLSYTTNQPLLTAAKTIGALILGGATAPTLTTSGSGTLTTTSLTFAGTGTIAASAAVTVNGDLKINSSALAAVTGASILTVKGNFSNATSATFTSIGNTVDFAGSTQSISNANTTSSNPTVQFKNLTFTGAGTKTFSGVGYTSVAFDGLMTLGASVTLSIPSSSTHLQFLTGTTLTFAQIATIPSTSSIQGNIDYYVYFQGGSTFRSYRSMGAPVYTGSYSASNGSYNLSSLKNSFIITGPSPNGTNLFDKSTNNGNTLKFYASATDTYTYASTINTTVATGTGFYMYFRGNRTPVGTSFPTTDPYGAKTNKTLGTPVGSYATPEAVTYTYTGVPNQGNVTSSIPTWNAFTTPYPYYFIANPYPATFDASALINSTTYAFGTLYYIARYTWTWSPSASAYAVYDQATPAASTNGAKRYVIPGQGFFIQNNNFATFATQTLTITESMKSTGNSPNSVRLLSTSAPEKDVDPPVMRLQFSKNNFINDEIGIVLQSTAKDSLDRSDATHMGGDYMNLTTITPDNKYLAIDKRPFTGNKIVIPLFINVAEDSIYTFKKTFTSSMMSNYKVTLYDSLLNNNVQITNLDYSFNVARSKPETFGGKRFKLIIESSPAPTTYFDFGGKLNADRKALLKWQTNSYRWGTTYQVQRSQDNVTFVNVGPTKIGNETVINNNFEVLDDDIQLGNNYYRLVQTDVFDNKSMSNTVLLKITADVGPVDIKNGFKLFPNPVSDKFSIISDKSYSGKVTMRIFNTNSDIIVTEAFNQLTALEPIQQYVSQLRAGVYFVELRDVNTKVLTTLKFVKQ